jgi:hypothetical protein
MKFDVLVPGQCWGLAGTHACQEAMMKQVMAIWLLMIIFGCGHAPDGVQESDVHGDVINIFSAATDTRLDKIWILTAQCMRRREYVLSVPAPPTIVLVEGQIDCGGETAVGCTDGTTVWLTVSDMESEAGVTIVAHEFVHAVLHNAGIFGEGHPAFYCVPVVQKEFNESNFHFVSGGDLRASRRH